MGWRTQGLPYGRLALENALRIHNATEEGRWPVIVDADGIALSWVQNMCGESHDGYILVSSHAAGLRKRVQTAARTKKSVIIEIVCAALSITSSPSLRMSTCVLNELESMLMSVQHINSTKV